ncbi:HNH endonuclease [Pseudomonas paralcaligenes]|uniref:HNH endonuclease n=1 Tax=Pseudomonas paralcaligenes TaxID=2772558 RepID=UPI001C7E94EB|nr:HNH endonuclease [Pseudomonas paralcaligenes]
MLERGIIRRAQIDLSRSNCPDWAREKAARILANPSLEVDKALPDWINRLVADKTNTTKVFKMIRAHRRGLLHFDRPHRWGYRSDWPDVARSIRKLDHFACVACGETNVELHVHHIVYVSNYGTHQQGNLVTLCRHCHELEHGRELDFGEQDEPRCSGQ